LNNTSLKDEFLREQGLVFYAKITASLSHELNNALAIINEHNGLLDDMLMASKQGVPLDEKKLHRSSQKIGLQIERGKELIRRLNKFAHSSDSFIAEIDITELLESIIALSQRLVSLKGVDLEFVAPSTGVIPYRTNPFYLQQAVFTSFEIFMINSEDNRLIQVTTNKINDKISIKITGSTIDKSEIVQRKTELLKILLDQLNGDLEIVSENEINQSIFLLLKKLTPAIQEIQ